MAIANNTMTNRGPDKKATAQQIIHIMENYRRPVWTASSIGDELGVSRPTIQDRLEEVEKDPRVKTMQVGNTKSYYLSDEGPRSIEEQRKHSIIEEYTDKFVGLLTEPWTAVHPNDGPAEAGDKVQIHVKGVAGNWGTFMTRTWEKRRKELTPEETSADETDALITGELYSKPTTPIEHTDYPDDYDLELNIGGEYKQVEGRSRPILIVPGVKNYLVKPCNDAVFLKDVSVDWISPKGEGQEVETYHIANDDVSDLLEKRGQEKALESYRDETEVADVEDPVKDSIPKPRKRSDSDTEGSDE